ncbi:sugar ABC transporter permease [Jonesiaceae bacterium BS-20]|uniref:Sugar ABC transporter permease n=1 Tax=Jonesiaceae bacterium BS-20 TaxID=3120821 RepID=A0AAU7DUQ5_9MICO
MSLTKDTETVVGAGFRKSKKSWSGWMFMAPFIVVFALVLLAPILYAVYLSLFETRMIGGSQFVGFDNFLRAFKDAQFWDGVLRILKFFAMQVPIMLGLALAAALAIDSSRLKGKNFFRIGIFVPYAVPAVVATLMWGFMFGDRFGLIGNLNEFFNINIPSLLSANLILLAIANIQIWTFTGYNMLIFYSSLRTIPEELYEAAELDGANQWWIIRSIKLPALRGAMVITTVFSIIGSFQLFNEPNVLKGIVPNSITSYFTPNMYAYNLAFSGQQHNYSATIALIMGVLTMVIAYSVQHFGTRKDER